MTDQIQVGKVRYSIHAAKMEAIRNHLDLMLFREFPDTQQEAVYNKKKRDQILRAMPDWCRRELHDGAAELARILLEYEDEQA